MDKMCQNLETSDVNEGITETAVLENAKRCESPVFKCVNQAKLVRENHLNSSDCDISSYQIFQSTKSVTSKKYKNHTAESVVPLSSVFSPISVVSEPEFQPPVNNLDIVTKNLDKTCQKRMNNFLNSSRIDHCKPCGIFESLGMTDKDISWVSSMASPPPKQITRSDYNTVEKATFFPEENFQCIQPRALFSPAFDDDFGCHPITFTSGSDDDDDENKEYKSNIRLSDVCATLKELEVKSLDQPLDSVLEKTVIEEDPLISPVIQTKNKQLSDNLMENTIIEDDPLISPVIQAEKKKKLNNVKKKNKVTLIVSPNNKNDFSLSENLKGRDYNKTKPSDGNNFMEDDSFQSISFSSIDELCRTLVTEKNNSSVVSKCNSCDETLINSKPNSALKKFYSTRIATEVHTVSSMDDLHSYAIALEEGDKYIPGDNKIDKSYTDKGIIRFDILNEDYSKVGATRQVHLDATTEKDECNEKNIKKINDINSDWDTAKQYLSESQLNISDSEIFRTVEHLEKTLASQESKEMEKIISEGSTDSKSQEVIYEMSFKHKTDLLETSRAKTCNTKYCSQNLLTIPPSTFTTARGSKISVSKKALDKAQEILKDCFENLENVDSQKLVGGLNRSDEAIKTSETASEVADGAKKNFMKKFLTGSEEQIKISPDTFDLGKTKTVVSKSEATETNSIDSIQNILIQHSDESKVKFQENLKKKLLSGQEKIEISTEALKDEDFAASKFVEGAKLYHNDTKSSMEGFPVISNKEIQISAEGLQKAKTFMVDCLEKEEMISMKGFMTGSGKPIQVSAKSLEKARAFLSECDEDFKENVISSCEENQNSVKPFKTTLLKNYNENTIQNPIFYEGFLTGSGKTIQISHEAIEKAKSFMKNCECKLSESPENLDSVWIKKVIDQAFNNCKAQKAEINIYNDANRKLQTKEDDLKNFMTNIPTDLSEKLKVSNQVLAETSEFRSKSDKTRFEVAENLVKSFPQAETPFMGFETAGGSKITVSAVALAKAKERMTQGDQNKLEDCVKCDHTTNNLKNVSETINSEGNPYSESVDWDEIPSWLQVYSTSPSIASSGIEISHEIGKSLKLESEYIVKSPVLGSRDRFYGKKRKRKLLFEEGNKSENKNLCSFVVPYKEIKRKNTLKRTLNLSLDFCAPFKKIKFVEDVKAVNLDIKEQRALAREEQEKILKEKQKVKPLKGSYLSRKCSEKQMSWMEAVAGSSPEIVSYEFLRSFGILEDILHINVENAVSFRFNGEHFFGSDCVKNVKGISLGDGSLVILDDENRCGVEEVKRAFLASPGVQPNLVPHRWVENHYKWIVWKLAHYEKSFPQYFGGRCLTPNHVLLQLKYRYDREIDRNERSALKKILEKDDTSIKRLVLCVCGIKKIATGYELNLTDGWYSCPARTDPAMTKFIEKGKLFVGTKLMTQGAALINCEQGASPLEIGDDVRLKISTNSTRRVKWDTKLGFQKNPENFPISLGSILPQGGPISRIDVIVVRIYPVLYMEKTLDGHNVTRNRRSEEKADAEYKKIREQRIEVIFNEVQAEMRMSLNSEKKSSLNSTKYEEDLGQLIKINSTLQDLLSADRRNLEKFESNQSDYFNLEMVEKIEKRLEKEKLMKRNVSEFLRAKIVDFRKPDYNNTALLSVWNPNEDITALFSEGKIISLMNVTISNSSRICKPLQINTTRQTRFRQIVKNVKYPSRKLTKLKDLSSRICPAFEEVDLVGMVVFIQEVSYGSRLSQNIYLTDLERNFVEIVFWGNCKDYGWENVLKIPSVVACINLQWKKNHNPQIVPSLYVNENSLFTENPRHDYLKEEMERLKQNVPQNLEVFLSECEENITAKLEESKWCSEASKNSKNDSTRSIKFQGTNDFESEPRASSTPIKPFTFKISSEEAELSPIQKRIEKLQSYGEPPSLIPLIIKNNMNKKFKKKS